jgi:hypothetical protein
MMAHTVVIGTSNSSVVTSGGTRAAKNAPPLLGMKSPMHHQCLLAVILFDFICVYLFVFYLCWHYVLTLPKNCYKLFELPNLILIQVANRFSRFLIV